MNDDFRTELIQAEPEKRFFIEILTRDIELIPAILELVDNSVDSARELHPDGNFKGLRVEIEAKSDAFFVQDNCAGISLKAAREYVFKIGRPSGSERVEGSIGQFGVGMKRALFKMGSEFSVESTTTKSKFALDLNVGKWEKAPGWELELQVAEKSKFAKTDTGTLVIVHSLLPSVAEAFGDSQFETRLRGELESKHRDAIDHGLEIKLNGRGLRGTPTELATSPSLVPGIKRFGLSDTAGRHVDVEIVVGVLPGARTPDDEAPEETEAAEREGGWYVFGNGRLLLEADKSLVTGWGTGKAGMPLWHNQFSRFRGYVYMEALEPEALPWTTTKTGVETWDPIWQKVRGEMIKQGATVIRMLNALKNERATGDPSNLPVTVSLKAAKTTTVAEVAQQADQAFSFPTPEPTPKQSAKSRRITYLVTVRDFEAVSTALDESEPSEVGRATFYNYHRRFVELRD